MEWPIILLILMSGFLLLIMTGMPVAICFFAINIFGLFVFWGGTTAFSQILPSIFTSVASFIMVPVVLFIFMGEIMFHSGIAPNMIKTLDLLLSRLPGRLSLVTVGGGTLLGTLTGAEMATTAILGRTLLPEMENAGYSKDMSLGAILGSGGLAILIPPSGLAIVMGALGKLSIAKLLMAIIGPGLLMAFILAAYFIVRSLINPGLAPAYGAEKATFKQKIWMTTIYILPISIVIFLVIGVIFLGIATPSEAAATGAFGSFCLTLVYGKVNKEMLKKTFSGTVQVATMVLLIVSSAILFSQILAYAGITQGMVRTLLSLKVDPIYIVIGTQIIILVAGMFMDVLAIMMITVPLFIPALKILGVDPIWWATMSLVNITIGGISPPFGLCLFVLKGVAPNCSMGDIYWASVPRIIMGMSVVGLVMMFPQIALWLPIKMFG